MYLILPLYVMRVLQVLCQLYARVNEGKQSW